jgi:sugar porter (SP) family MFS transporter
MINIIAFISSIFYIISKKIESFEILIVTRFLTGFLSGFFCGVCPLYLSELSPLNLGGFIGTINALAICFGNLTANIFGLPQILGTLNSFPYLLGVLPLILSLVHLVGLPFCVESPKYLFITKDRLNEARISLEKIRKNKNLVNFEMGQLGIEKDLIRNLKESTFLDLVSLKPLRKALLVTLILQASQQFSGIIAVITYSTRIFISMGLEADTWAIYAAILLSSIETICHFLCMFIIDLTGRRILLLIGLSGMSLCCFVLGLIQIFIANQLWIKILAVVIVTIYIIFYSFGPGPIPLLITAEVFNTEYRSKAISIAVFSNWFFNFLISVSFPYIEVRLSLCCSHSF